MTPEEGYKKALRRIDENTQTKATFLDLSQLNLQQIPAVLEKFEWLRVLALWMNQISRIENLPSGLTHLILSQNQISRIENLPLSLKDLNLWSNQISLIGNLHEGLQNLQLIGNPVSKIENLPNSLLSLVLGSNKISQIENLPPNLRSLFLSSNQISRIENLPTDLTHLFLSNNQISRIEQLPHKLKQLDLQKNQIDSLTGLPIEIFDELEKIDLRGNPIQDPIPNDELNNKAVILGNLKSRDELISSPFLKVNIIGEGRIGKTQLLNYFANKPYQSNAPETHGTNTACYKIPKSEVQATVWDFGGQSYHHGFHKIFLGPTDFNLVLWRNQLGKKPDYGYWLGTARAFSSNQQDGSYTPPLMLVQNVWNNSNGPNSFAENADVVQFPDSVKMETYQVGFEQVFTIDVKALFDPESPWIIRHKYFLEELHKQMLVQARRKSIPRQWITIKRQVDRKGLDRFNLTKTEFHEQFASNIGDPDVFEALLGYLKFTGSILRFHDVTELSSYVFPNPPALSDWLFKEVLDKEFLSTGNGKLSQTSLKTRVKTDDEATIFLNLMRHFDLIFEQPKLASGDEPLETYYSIPQFLPDYQHSFKQVLLELLPFTFSLQFPDFLHEGRIFQFIATFGKYAFDHTAYWKYGLLYKHPVEPTSSGSVSVQLQTLVYYVADKRQLVVHIEDRKGRSEVARAVFDFFVFDRQPKQSSVKQIDEEEEQYLFPSVGVSSGLNKKQTESERERLLANLRTPVHLSTEAPYFLDVTKTAENIKSNNFFGECEESGKRVKLNFMAINLLSSDSRSKLRVFFSYSHKDEQYRDELDRHCAMLKRSGRIETWHDRKIVAGEGWDEKIKDQLQQADIVLLMISADFLHSDYIWEQELSIVRERYQKQDGIRVIPIFTRPCDTTDLDFMKLQGGQRDHQSQLLWISSSQDRDQIYTNIVGEIRKAIEAMR